MKTPTVRSLDEHLAVASPTVARCHVLGGILSIAVVLCTTWVWSLGRITSNTIEIDGQIVDKQDAKTLLENAGQWQSIHKQSLRQANAVRERTSLLTNWLPESVDWREVSSSIEKLASEADVTLLSLAQGKDSIGSRVGILQATCEIEGSYVGICHVLDGVAKRDQPIACSEIQLHRLRSPDNSKSAKCRATLTFRIPFAAKGTASHQVLVSHYENAARGNGHE